MVQNLRRGDVVVTQGGLIGKVAKVKENNELDLELAEGVKVRVVQSTIADVVSKTEPASD
jgi:preprotein translocase subunit YajC